MLKKILTVTLGIMLLGIIGFALRLWLIKESVEHINTVILDTANKNLEKLKSSANQISMPNSIMQTGSDQQHPKANLQDWDSISNKQQICWIHKKSHKKVCEQKS